MRNVAALLFTVMLAACATAPPPREPTNLLNDTAFRPASQRIDVADVFAVSPQMRQFLDAKIVHTRYGTDVRQALLDALYTRGGLQLDYDGTYTRTAAEAFSARSGNCLSLVIMTAAFARELGLPVQLQQAFTEDTWSRSGDVYLYIGEATQRPPRAD